LYELGFERAVAAWLKDEVEKKHNIDTVFENDELPKALDDNVRILLFRSVKELLFNIIRHAQARKVQVSIGLSNGDIKVQIQDDGIGFDYAEVIETAAVKAKLGLFSIRERLEHLGGRMEIDSAPGQGTIIKLFAPLKRK
jgi:signal transduction histidine kinase